MLKAANGLHGCQLSTVFSRCRKRRLQYQEILHFAFSGRDKKNILTSLVLVCRNQKLQKEKEFGKYLQASNYTKQSDWRRHQDRPVSVPFMKIPSCFSTWPFKKVHVSSHMIPEPSATSIQTLEECVLFLKYSANHSTRNGEVIDFLLSKTADLQRNLSFNYFIADSTFIMFWPIGGYQRQENGREVI